MIFSARNGDVPIFFAACYSRPYSSSVRYRSRELSSLKNLTRQTGFDAARLRAMHQLKNAFDVRGVWFHDLTEGATVAFEPGKNLSATQVRPVSASV